MGVVPRHQGLSTLTGFPNRHEYVIGVGDREKNDRKNGGGFPVSFFFINRKKTGVKSSQNQPKKTSFRISVHKPVRMTACTKLVTFTFFKHIWHFHMGFIYSMHYPRVNLSKNCFATSIIFDDLGFLGLRV